MRNTPESIVLASDAAYTGQTGTVGTTALTEDGRVAHVSTAGVLPASGRDREPVVVSAVQLPVNTDITPTDVPSTAQLPARTDVPSTAQLPARTDVPSTAQLPVRDDVPSTAQLPVRDDVPSTAQLPVRDDVPSTAQLPVRDDVSSIAQLPAHPETASNTSTPNTEPVNLRLRVGDGTDPEVANEDIEQTQHKGVLQTIGTIGEKIFSAMAAMTMTPRPHDVAPEDAAAVVDPTATGELGASAASAAAVPDLTATAGASTGVLGKTNADNFALPAKDNLSAIPDAPTGVLGKTNADNLAVPAKDNAAVVDNKYTDTLGTNVVGVAAAPAALAKVGDKPAVHGGVHNLSATAKQPTDDASVGVDEDSLSPDLSRQDELPREIRHPEPRAGYGGVTGTPITSTGYRMSPQDTGTAGKTSDRMSVATGVSSPAEQEMFGDDKDYRAAPRSTTPPGYALQPATPHNSMVPDAWPDHHLDTADAVNVVPATATFAKSPEKTAESDLMHANQLTSIREGALADNTPLPRGVLVGDNVRKSEDVPSRDNVGNFSSVSSSGVSPGEKLSEHTAVARRAQPTDVAFSQSPLLDRDARDVNVLGEPKTTLGRPDAIAASPAGDAELDRDPSMTGGVTSCGLLTKVKQAVSNLKPGKGGDDTPKVEN